MTGDASEPRNAASLEPTQMPASRSIVAAGPTTDLRFTLEAMTQMMRTNADALRIVTASHVDLAKTIAVAKGLPRNASMFVPPPTITVTDEEDEYDDEEDEEHDRPKNWADVALPIVEQIAPALPGLLALIPQKTRPGSKPTRGAPTPPPFPQAPLSTEEAELARKPRWEARDLLDLSYAKRKGDAMRKAEGTGHVGVAEPAAPSPQTLQTRVMRDPALMRKVFAIKAQLDADEMALLLNALDRSALEEQDHFLEQLKAVPEEQCVAVCRELLSILREPPALIVTNENANQ